MLTFVAMERWKEKAALIWDVADLLRGDYLQSDYGKVLLPMTVLRRLDCVLAGTKAEVLAAEPKANKLGDKSRTLLLNKKAGYNFHNRSQYDFNLLVADPNNIALNLRNYIAGFSKNARDILNYFKFDDQIDRMDDPESNILFSVVKEFQEIDLTHLESLEMGYAFERIIRLFAEQSNATAGEHFTPREVIRLMVNLLFMEDKEVLRNSSAVRTLYDPACGTGGMLSEGEKYVKELNAAAELKVFGQEINPESYAICKADMLIKGQNPSNIKFGNTFTVDGLRGETFDYLLSNPPFGVDWKKAKDFIENEAKNLGFSGRFGAGTPRINDGSLLFLQHMIDKMKDDGSRIAMVFNGSPLFSGAAGSGESEIRRWIIENDWLEAIVGLPDQMFYNTGISTYIWVLSNAKAEPRRGLVQLIDATGKLDEELVEKGELARNRFWEKMSPSLGNKRKAIVEEAPGHGIEYITQLYGDFTENDFCKIVPNEYFGYWRVTVEQPLENGNGEFVYNKKGEAKPDKSKRDQENIPFLRQNDAGELVPQTIDEYLEREVHPHLPNAWIDEAKTKIGYEINFTRYFYRFKPLRPLAEIRAEILALETKIRTAEQTILE